MYQLEKHLLAAVAGELKPAKDEAEREGCPGRAGGGVYLDCLLRQRL